MLRPVDTEDAGDLTAWEHHERLNLDQDQAWIGWAPNVVATGTGTIKAITNGQHITFHVSAAFITGPLIEAEAGTFNVVTPVPASVLKPLVVAVATRAAKG